MTLSNASWMDQNDAMTAEVAAYLRDHPDFFQHHLDVLETLNVPHPSGEAVSLVSRQLELLRERNRKLHAQINDILHIARDNDALFQRIHRLTLALLDATSLDDALASLRWLLHDCFDADFVAVRLLEPRIDCPIADLCVDAQAVETGHFRALLESGRPECGRTDAAWAAYLFGSDADEVRSHAAVPLQHAGLKGLLAIGSRDSSRFDADMGHLFLTQMGEIVAARLVALVNALP
jgi:uncharacterized protein YigA (DUF484 family)